MFLCENCNKYYTLSNATHWSSKRFCSSFCAHAYSSHFAKRNEKKEAKCVQCGKSILISKKASAKYAICEECKQNKNDNNNNYIFIKQHRQQIRTLIKYFHFNKEKLNDDKEAEIEYNRVRNELYNLYWNKHKSSTEIAKLYNYPSCANLVNKVFNYLNIPHKNSSYALSENILYGRFNSKHNSIYKHGWHKTWDNKKVYLRSSHEFDYAKYLDENKIKYEVENLRIEYFGSTSAKMRIAIPDFYLVESNTIVEIKSNYTLDNQNMRDKFIAYKKLGYNTKLILEHKEIENF